MAKVTRRRRKLADGTYRDAGWQVRYVDPAGRQRLKAFEKKGDANDFRTEVEHKTRVGAYVDPDAGKVTFEAYAEAWRSVQPWRPGTAAAIESRLRKWAYPVIGARPIGAVRPTEIQALVKKASESLAPKTVQGVANSVQAVFLGAVRDRLIYVSPATDLRLPNLVDEEPVVPLDRDQWTAFAAALPERWRIAAWIGVGAGLRGGEVRGLTVDRVEFLKRELRVDRQMVTLPSGKVTKFAALKTKASRRTLPVSATLLAELSKHIAKFPDPDAKRGLLLTTEDGRPVSRQVFSWNVAKAATLAGFGEKQRFHALRHTYASALIAGGCSIKVVQARMGHATAQETLDTYGHLWPDDDDRTRVAIEAALTPESAESETSTAP